MLSRSAHSDLLVLQPNAARMQQLFASLQEELEACETALLRSTLGLDTHFLCSDRKPILNGTTDRPPDGEAI